MKSKLIPGGGERQFKTGSSDHGAKASRHSQQEQQRHLQAYLSLRRLRAAVCRRYAALLEGKVFSQRLQQRNESARAKSGSQPEQKQKKLVFSKLQHSDSHMKSLPKTSHYLIFALQKQLAKSGHLKCHRDLEDFYGRIKYNSHPSQLQKSLQDVRRKKGARTTAPAPGYLSRGLVQGRERWSRSPTAARRRMKLSKCFSRWKVSRLPLCSQIS
ncbi:uncharacterized protein LOC115399273 [Salarias fasciatus]|uniref:uncharacterized protein LOC115399273 n=1 Tax=Salarias fasciatus TaxID=181472 RepID=UPI001176FF30|nr:uncharacterized protein LOC115399273 [Salarias fasciatus]